MSWGVASSISTVPACLDALVAAARRAHPDADAVDVVDGQPVKGTLDDVICIGFTSEPGEAAVQSALSRTQMATTPDQEAYDVTCLASSWAGEQVDPVIVRDRAYALVNGLATYLAQDPTLGDVVARARISTEAFAQEQTTRGAVATVQFVVHVDAFRR
ncbi:hypothetical protein [Herbidospora sp. RD11066]